MSWRTLAPLSPTPRMLQNENEQKKRSKRLNQHNKCKVLPIIVKNQQPSLFSLVAVFIKFLMALDKRLKTNRCAPFHYTWKRSHPPRKRHYPTHTGNLLTHTLALQPNRWWSNYNVYTITKVCTLYISQIHSEHLKICSLHTFLL